MSGSAPREPSTLSVLVVEDERPLARTIARALRAAGYDATVAHTLAEGRKLAAAHACGVFDADLPDGDGIGLAEELLAAGTVARAVVVFSASVAPHARERAERFGAFVHKREGLDALLRAIDAALVADR